MALKDGAVRAAVPVLWLAFLVAACTTQTPPAPVPSAPDSPAAPAADAGDDARVDEAWIARNGPSTAPQEGWVETVSGWFRSTRHCLRYHTAKGAAVPGEGCLERGI